MVLSDAQVKELLADPEIVAAEGARRDFGAYCVYVHGRPLYAHQREWAEIVMAVGDSVIVAPPGSYKTTLVRMLLEWWIGRDRESGNLYVMNTAGQSGLNVAAIAETLEHNPRYRRVFPGVVADKERGWSKEALFVKRRRQSDADPTLFGAGYDGPYQGQHPHRTVIDDPTDQKDVWSEATMAQQRERVRGVLYDRLTRDRGVMGNGVKVIMTRWGEADLLPTFTEMGFKVYVYPVEGRYAWGRLLFPERYSDQILEEIRRAKRAVTGVGTMSGGLYDLTFMCNPSAAEGAMLKREWWRYYSTRPRCDVVVQSWDLSVGRNTRIGDYSAYGMWGIAENGYYQLDAGRWRLPMDDLAAKMKLLYETWRPSLVLVEDSGTTMPTVDYLRAHTRIPLMPVKPGTSNKRARVKAIEGLIQAGRVWLPAGQPWVQDFVDEVARFPSGQYDDQVDQMSQALNYLDTTGSYQVTGGGQYVNV